MEGTNLCKLKVHLTSSLSNELLPNFSNMAQSIQFYPISTKLLYGLVCSTILFGWGRFVSARFPLSDHRPRTVGDRGSGNAHRPGCRCPTSSSVAAWRRHGKPVSSRELHAVLLVGSKNALTSMSMCMYPLTSILEIIFLTNQKSPPGII